MTHVPVSRLLSAAALMLALEAAAVPAMAEDLKSSPLIVQRIDDIRPVVGADGKTHLVYELLFVNQSPFTVSIDEIVVVDANTNFDLETLSGGKLATAARLTPLGGAGTLLQPSQSSLVFIDAAVSAGHAPSALINRVTVTQTATATGAVEHGGLTATAELGARPTIMFETEVAFIDTTPPIVLVAPVHGDNWIMFRGCCDLASSHRGGANSYNGALRITERFAIDLVQMDESGLMIAGPGDALTSYVYYGQPIYAVADGTVVSARNDQPEQVPGTLPNGIAEELAGGNAAVIDIGGGAFAFYAHMQTGSVLVKAGDRVRAGDQIGNIGNSGKTIGPHLHFHLSTASGVGGDGLPFVFSKFVGEGALNGDGLMQALTGQPAEILPDLLAGPHVNAMPLNNQVVDFGRE